MATGFAGWRTDGEKKVDGTVSCFAGFAKRIFAGKYSGGKIKYELILHFFHLRKIILVFPPPLLHKKSCIWHANIHTPFPFGLKFSERMYIFSYAVVFSVIP